MPRTKKAPRKYNPRSGPRRSAMGRRVSMFGKYLKRRVPRAITTNTASVKECYSVPVIDGQVIFFRQIALSDLTYDRSQTVASAYQEFRIKYVKMTFRPSADTYAPVPGNIIPQLYWQIDKANAIPLNADSNTFLSMGTRPRRMDDKNLVFTFKPAVLTSDMVNPGATTAGQVKVSPWLSTNANSGNPAAGWAPSAIEHLGCVFYVTKINPADDITYNVDVEVVFQFRKPIWKGGATTTEGSFYLEDGQIKPVTVTPTVIPVASPSGA